MSAQRLGEKGRRRIERDVGEPVLRAWSHGGYVFDFVTPDHRHGWWDKKTREWGWSSEPLAGLPPTFLCYNTCAELPPLTFGSTNERETP